MFKTPCFHCRGAGDVGSYPGWGTKIPHATRHSQTTKKELLEVVIWGDYFLQDVIFSWFLINSRKQLGNCFFLTEISSSNLKESVTIWYKVMHVPLYYSGPFNTLLILIQ